MVPQKQLFYTTMQNFIIKSGKSEKHREILKERFPIIDNMAIDTWLKERCFPLVRIRVLIMDFIWTHNCNCQCPQDPNPVKN